MKTVVKFRLKYPIHVTPELPKTYWAEFTRFQTMSGVHGEYQIEADNPVQREVLAETADVVALVKHLALRHDNQVTDVVSVHGVKAPDNTTITRE